MTLEQIKNLIDTKIAGQGSAIDAASVLPEILNGICDIVEEANEKAKVLDKLVVDIGENTGITELSEDVYNQAREATVIKFHIDENEFYFPNISGLLQHPSDLLNVIQIAGSNIPQDETLFQIDGVFGSIAISDDGSSINTATVIVLVKSDRDSYYAIWGEV